jgi:glycerol-3-phosphate acyltransferase PlsX
VPLKIAVDAMGGDLGYPTVATALTNSLRKNPRVSALVYCGSMSVEKDFASAISSDVRDRVEIRPCTSVVLAEDKPSSVLRLKQNSSMGCAVRAVSTGEADACISSGNTGALMALAVNIIKTLPNISRPAICTAIPTIKGRTLVLDLGANTDCSAQLLSQFAILGSLTAQLLYGLASPRVSLLNVGSELNKGNQTVRHTASILQANQSINYDGFIEGDDIFTGTTDVVVCDGFSGNVALKASEGVALLIDKKIEHLFETGHPFGLFTFFFKRFYSHLKTAIHPSSYNGAYLLGLNGVVVKSHGAANETAFSQAIEAAIEAAQLNVPKFLTPLLAKTIN